MVFAQEINISDLHNFIDEISVKYEVNPTLVKAIIKQESGYNLAAVSRVGAKGLMQLMPATASRFGVVDSFDPFQNIQGGIRYLSFLTRRYPKDIRLAIAAYNAGEGNVDKYMGIPPFSETQNYVKRVLSNFNSNSTGFKESIKSSDSKKLADFAEASQSSSEKISYNSEVASHVTNPVVVKKVHPSWDVYGNF